MERVDLNDVLAGVRPGGCVQRHIEGFAAELMAAGYATLPVRDYARAAAHLGRWLESRNLAIEKLCEAVVTSFARHKCRCQGASRQGRRPSRRQLRNRGDGRVRCRWRHRPSAQGSLGAVDCWKIGIACRTEKLVALLSTLWAIVH